MKKIYFTLVLVLLNSCASTPPLAIQQSEEKREQFETKASKFVIASQGIKSSQAAVEVMKKGGNIIDAAVAASFVISVERPHSTGIGGGGFLLYREAKTKQIYAVDFRERAPLKATKNMFLNKHGEVIPGLSTDSVLASGAPGLVAGLIDVHKKFGKLTLKEVMAPAIELADKGFAIYSELGEALEDRKAVLKKSPAALKIFFNAKGRVLKAGENLVQKDLAKTLRLISEKGVDGFYKGTVAKAITSEFARLNGLLTEKDLRSYKVKWRAPVNSTFHKISIYSMPPPSSGGVHVLQILNTIENDDLKSIGFLSTQSTHIVASSMQMAFADRAKYLGDPDFVKVPVETLISKKYAKIRRIEINPEKARKSSDVSQGLISSKEHPQTTHMSLMDEEGNVVATTQTINGWMGSGIVVPGTGILLNNEMDDFSAKPGASNMFGAVGSDANAIAPGKTPLSSMSPTIVLEDNEPIMALGAPGGTRIISCVVHTILNYFEYKFPLYESVASVRFHHQWLPDKLTIEPPGVTKPVSNTLQYMGYDIENGEVPCLTMAVTKEGSKLHGVSDPRDFGSAMGF